MLSYSFGLVSASLEGDYLRLADAHSRTIGLAERFADNQPIDLEKTMALQIVASEWHLRTYQDLNGSVHHTRRNKINNVDLIWGKVTDDFKKLLTSDVFDVFDNVKPAIIALLYAVSDKCEIDINDSKEWSFHSIYPLIRKSSKLDNESSDILGKEISIPQDRINFLKEYFLWFAEFTKQLQEMSVVYHLDKESVKTCNIFRNHVFALFVMVSALSGKLVKKPGTLAQRIIEDRTKFGIQVEKLHHNKSIDFNKAINYLQKRIK